MSSWEMPSGLSLAAGGAAIDPEWWPDNPRGLLSIGYPAGPGGRQILINYIAVEPVVGGARGYSELETGPDGIAGLPWVVCDDASGQDGLDITFTVSGFANGAAVGVRAQVLASSPHEVRLTSWAEPGSPQPDLCVLSATMGNMARLRTLELGRRRIDVSDLGADFDSWGFTAGRRYPLEGELIARAYPGPEEPLPLSGANDGWDYRGTVRLAQYWRLPEQPSGEAWALVNSRRVYWASGREIPGGPALENFELQVPYRRGATVIFGVEPV